METRTNIDDLLDLQDFDPQSEKEEYMGFHENIEKYAAQLINQLKMTEAIII